MLVDFGNFIFGLFIYFLLIGVLPDPTKKNIFCYKVIKIMFLLQERLTNWQLKTTIVIKLILFTFLGN